MQNGVVQKTHSGRNLITSRTVQSAMQWWFLPVFDFSLRLRHQTARQRRLEELGGGGRRVRCLACPSARRCVSARDGHQPHPQSLGHEVCLHPGLRERGAVPSAHGQGCGLHERARLRCEGWSGLAGHMQGSPPKVRRIGVLFWRAPPLLMSPCSFRGACFRRGQVACAPVHVSLGAICLSYAAELCARLVCGAPLCVSSWCLANVPMFLVKNDCSHVRNAMWNDVLHFPRQRTREREREREG